MGASLCALATRQEYFTPIDAVDASSRSRFCSRYLKDFLFPPPIDVPEVAMRVRRLLPDAVDAIVKAADCVVAGLIPLNSGGQIDTNLP